MCARSVSIPLDEENSVSAVLHAPERSSGVSVILGHGAGNDMTNPLVVAVCDGLSRRGHAALRFNFPYKERGQRAPDPRPRLEHAYRAAVAMFRELRGEDLKYLVIGGKSLGGRIASLLAASGLECDGLVFLGYPLHPAGDREKVRDGHLGEISAPMLFIQGTRDALCDLTLLRPVLDRLGPSARLHTIEGGDHSFDLLKSVGRSRESVYEEAVEAVDRWLVARFGGKV
jgi:uncharacterized protein